MSNSLCPDKTQNDFASHSDHNVDFFFKLGLIFTILQTEKFIQYKLEFYFGCYLKIHKIEILKSCKFLKQCKAYTLASAICGGGTFQLLGGAEFHC